MIRLTSIALQNFKSIHAASVQNLNSINVFFGPTNSGKTSFLESIYFQCNHQRLLEASQYDEFLHSKADRANATLRVETHWEVRDAIPNVNLRPRDELRLVTHVFFSGKHPEARDEVFINGKQEENAERQTAIFLQLRSMVRLSSSRRPGDSKKVYFAGPEETPDMRRHRFLQELDELELQGEQYQEFLSHIQRLFPHLVYDMASKENIIEFFGMGFLGTAKLLLYLFDARSTIVLIDEPEIHFYPSLTRRFVQALHEVVENLGKQIFLSTHATLFLQERNLGNFYHIAKSQHFHTVVRQVMPSRLLRDVSIANIPSEDVLQSDVVIYTEGPWDVAVMEEFLRKFPELDHVAFAVFQLGGGAMGNTNVDPVKLKMHNPLSFVVVDSERTSEHGDPDPAHRTFQERCAKAHVYCLMLQRHALENYFTPQALRAVFGDRIPKAFTNHPYKPLTHQGLRWYEKSWNQKVAAAMSREEVESSPDLRAFFTELIHVSKQFQ